MEATIRRPKTGINPRKFGLARAAGASVQAAMLTAGYSSSCARKGRQKASRECLIQEQKCIAERGEELRKVGLALTAEQQRDLVRGRLTMNVISGDDSGSASAKLLGSDRRVNMWTPENTTGIIVVSPPQLTPLPPMPDDLLEAEEEQK